MKPKLILHAGTHKTGTTAIQAFAARHREALAGRGILYPDLAPLGIDDPFPQHRFAHALAGADRTLGPAAAVRLAGLWAEAAAAGGATVLVSAEPLYRHTLGERGGKRRGAAGGGGRAPDGDWRAGRARYLDRLAAALAPFEVQAVLVFRRPDDFVRALFQETAMRARAPTLTRFPAFRAHAAGDALRYADNAALFAERFGGLRGLVYEDLPAGTGFAAAAFAALGLDASGLAPVGVVRESLTPAQTAAKLALHRLLAGGASKAALQAFVRTPGVTALLAERLGPGPFDLWESAAARDGFLAAQAPGIERLRAAVFPDRAALFPPPRPLAPPAPAIDAALAARLAELAAAAGLGGAALRKSARSGKPDRTAAHAARAAAATATAAAPAPPAEPPAHDGPPAKPGPRAQARPAAPNGAARRRARRKARRAAGTRTAAPGGARRIGDFVVIVGAMKSGTTSLFDYLAAHPQIAACRRKEPNFFSRRYRGRNPARYFALWPDFDPELHRYALEASASYSKFPNHAETPARMAQFAAEQGARFKLIYILRDPIERIESHVAHNVARRPERAATEPFTHEVAVSSYARQLDRYLRRFPRADLLVLNFDDLRADPRALVGRAFDFLGLETPADLAVRPPANPRRDANGSTDFRLDEDQRAALRTALRADVAELRDRLGMDVEKWNIL